MFGVILLAILNIIYNYVKVRQMSSGTEEMIRLAETIRNGASTFLKVEYRTISVIVLVLAGIFSLFIEKTSGATFLIGAAMSSAACILGMKSATHCNVRTTNRARISLSIGETVKTALNGGSISGLSVHAFGLLGLATIYFAFGGIKVHSPGAGFLANFGTNASVMRFTTYSLGCSTVAMFNRVAGGNYTKAADISADILAKIRHDMPEDDRRNPCTIADFIGDNVNDIAGNCSDLLESFVATMVAAMIIAMTMYRAELVGETPAVPEATFDAMVMFPMMIGAGGLLACILGMLYISVKRLRGHPGRDLDSATYTSAMLTVVLTGGIAYLTFADKPLYPEFLLGWASPWISTVLGILAGVMIGMVTERYTSTDFAPTRKLAEIAPEGDAFVVTKGDAIGSRSVLVPAIIISAAIVFSGKLCGGYGIAMAALGMLSFVGTTVSIDAFGPISDNAGGIAESCNLNASVRKITDELDAAGNTTAAIGKGFAIGSAALATVSLITAYVGNYTAVGQEPVLNAAAFAVVAGMILGGGLIEYFSALLTDNTIEAARKMADIGDEILTDEVIAGTAEPDYDACIREASNNALGYMVLPSVLAMLVPVVGGILLGFEFVGGILVGATIVAIGKAIFMGNSGGAFDNAKKYIESDKLKGHPKGSDAHKASVTGDTVGDTRKDVVGVALDIFIKMMSTVANTLAPVFTSLRLFH